MTWCEHCRDHYELDHYTASSNRHRVGAKYGPTGEQMAQERFRKRESGPRGLRPDTDALTLRLDRAASIMRNEGLTEAEEFRVSTLLTEAANALRARQDRARKMGP